VALEHSQQIWFWISSPFQIQSPHSNALSQQHETTQAAAKRARTELLQEQENTQHSMDIDASPKKRMEELITRKNDKKMKWSQYECIRKDKRDA
jgi:hypothetical protein